MSTGSLIDLLHGYLSVASNRQQVIAANMANVDTPGYHARDINFQAALQQAVNAEGIGQQLEPASIEVQGLPERPDGNDVKCCAEQTLLDKSAKNQAADAAKPIDANFHCHGSLRFCVVLIAVSRNRAWTRRYQQKPRFPAWQEPMR